MSRHIPSYLGIIAAFVAGSGAAFAAETQSSTPATSSKWTTAEQNGRIEARLGDELMLGWQAQPLANPQGGAKFAGSAFFHPLRTPGGFEWTHFQPTDHLHHFGLWWPWKFIEVDGNKSNCWEIQEGQGGHVARGVKPISTVPGSLAWEFSNETQIKKTHAQTAIHETARVTLSVSGDAQILDISLRQKAAGSPVKILAYRYSGFSWRGPKAWDKDSSTMTTSEGKGRDDANGVAARWVMVSGKTPNGSATVLIMSAASKLAGNPERLRVWDSKAEKGTPFVNFNPVMETALPLDDAHPAVSNRRYRVIAADRTIDAASAETEWREWMKSMD